MAYEKVVWDFDGVLVDSRAEAWRVASQILRLVGIDVEIESQEIFRKYFTLDGILSADDRSVLKSMHRLVMKNRTDRLSPHPCLKLVTQLNVPSDIVTSSLKEFAERVLGEDARQFSSIHGYETDSKEALILKACANGIFLTDTVVDIERCKKHSIPVIGVSWGYDPLSALKDAGPDFIAESVEDLSKVFKKLKLLD